MFCRKCGNRLNDEARFCTKCGAAVGKAPDNARSDGSIERSIANETIKQDVSEISHDENKSDFTSSNLSETKTENTAAFDSENDQLVVAESEQAEASFTCERNEGAVAFAGAMDETKKRSRRRMPLIVLVALVTLLLSSVAFAAYKVYTEIIAPWIEAQQEAPVENNSEEEAVEEVVATGDPQHVLQIAEILSMPNAADIPVFFENQGFTAENAEGVDGHSYTTWKCPSEDLQPFSPLSDAGIGIEGQSYPGEALTGNPSRPTIYLGPNAVPPHGMINTDTEGYTSTESGLANGQAPSSIHVTNLPLPLFDADEAEGFLTEAKLGSILASDTVNPAEGTANDLINDPTNIYAGAITVQDKKCFWYFMQRPLSAEQGPGASLSYVDSFMGCCTEQSALQAVLDSELYTADEWNEGTDESKALMAAHAIAQSNYVSMDGFRNNMITGEYESRRTESEDNSSTDDGFGKWLDRDEYAAVYGESSAMQRFDNYIVGYETGEAAKAPATKEEKETEVSAKEGEYGYETAEISVSLPSDPVANPEEMVTQTWTYPQITSTQNNEHVTQINAQIEAEVTEKAQLAEAWDISNATEEQCMLLNYIVTYQNDDVVSILKNTYNTLYGAHGWNTCEGATYDLSTGKQISPAGVFGLDDQQATNLATEAVSTFIQNNPDKHDLDSTRYVQEAISNIANRTECMYLEPEGLVVVTQAYDLGAYANGEYKILVKAFENESLEGTAL